MIIPRGAQSILRNADADNLVEDLESVTVDGGRYITAAQAYHNARRTGLEANKRTGGYVGGEPVCGIIARAVAGRAQRTANGAVTGGLAGAGAQVPRHGQAIRIPVEAVLMFRLEQPLEVVRGRYTQDDGIDHDGYHYHEHYYHRETRQ